MDFSLTQEQQQIRDAIRKLCARFDDDYWLEKDAAAASRTSSTAAMAEAGWLGIAMPEEYGGAGPRHHRGRAHDAGDRRIGRRPSAAPRRCT